MRSFVTIALLGALICASAQTTMAQEGESDATTNRTMHPVVRLQLPRRLLHAESRRS